MNSVDRLLCKKMQATGCQVAFKSADSKWIFMRSASEDSEEKRAKLYAEGIGIEHFDGCVIYYFCDDWEFRESHFYPKKSIVKSVPVAVTDFDRPDFESLATGLSNSADMIDLTGFYGVITGIFLHADKVIIGNDVCFFNNEVPSVLNILGFSYMELLLDDRNLSYMSVDANDVTIVGREPIKSLQCAFMNTSINSLDMSEVDLSACKSFNGFCMGCVNLHSVKIGGYSRGCTKYWRIQSHRFTIRI